MNSAARKYNPPASDFSAPKAARAKGRPVYRRYAVRLSGQPDHTAVVIDDAESQTEAAIIFAERAAFVGRKLSVLVTDCQTYASCSFILDFEGGSVGS